MASGIASNTTPHPLFRLGFRPLFLFGALSAVLLIGWWTYYWTALTMGGSSIASEWQPVGGAVWWHAHEMVFGFTTAIIGGFLLTAVRNWTGIATITGKPLMVLALLWVTTRLSLALGPMLSMDARVVLLIDELYFFGLILAVGHPIIKAKMWRNLMFVPILLAFAVLNALSYSSVLGLSGLENFSISAIHAGVFLIVLIIAIIGGRVLPFFTANGLGIPKTDSIPALDAISILSLVTLVGCALYGFSDLPSWGLAGLAFIAGIANLIRLVRLKFWLCFRVSLLWSLHLFYSFIPIGLIALGFYAMGVIDSLSLVLHLMTVGAIGGMILSMITRVSLGHTGRPLKASKALSVAFGLLFFSVMARSVLPLILPASLATGILWAGTLWVIAFGVFVVIHGPYLWSARPDGKPI